jgi:hypothetical protein
VWGGLVEPKMLAFMGTSKKDMKFTLTSLLQLE